MTEQEKVSAAKRLWHNITDTVYGMAAHDMSRAALRTRASMEHLFILITMGDLLGIPDPAAVLQPAAPALRRAADRHVETAHVAREGRRGRDVLGSDTVGFKDVFLQHPERRYIMFGGGGGVGKTTFSAAAAYWLASHGKKVLVFSVDPQASLTDIFKRDIFGKGPVQIMDKLWAQEIDADSHIRAYQQEIRQKILDMYGLPAVPDEIENYIQAASAEPAMEESAMFDAVVDVVMKGDYDYYIYDLVPLGHALYYLSMAKVYDEWINKVTKLREEMREYEEMVSRIRREKITEQDQILQELLYIKNRINTSAGILTDKTKTAFFFVVIPEAGVINDTQKAAKMFAQFDVPLAGYVVNRVIPHELLGQNIPEYLRRRIAMQDQNLLGVRTAFGDHVLAMVPEMERDVTGLPMIEKLAAGMFA